jgi:2-succinyl-5-enolpyruvyl-6-hydroxy-3-cyclohexene-1-carboxylate synthase
MKNIESAVQIVSELKNHQVSEFVFCAGVRNSAIFKALKAFDNIKVSYFYEERSAGFFAMGRTRMTGKPVAVVTTSGTAVAELLPSVIESFYQGLPLIVLSADRPKHFRGTGAPQSIEQKGIFGSYVKNQFDLQGELLNLSHVSWNGPIHINVCFDEPLIDAEITTELKNRFLKSSDLKNTPQNTLRGSEPIAQKINFNQYVNPALILGPMDNQQSQIVLSLINQMQVPVYPEVLSQLRGQLKNQINEETLNAGVAKGMIQSLIRVGGVPTVRLWRDLEAKFRNIPVCSFYDLPLSGLGRPSDFALGIENLITISELKNNHLDGIITENHKSQNKLMALLEQLPQSECGLIYKSQSCFLNHDLYLGNSLPIRQADLVFWNHQFNRCYGNRGANGIDGQISTFLGWSDNANPSIAMVGDLTALYDLSALSLEPFVQGGCAQIMVINNSGGQIFNRIIKDPEFLNQHSLSFKNWAAMFGWTYQQWKQIPNDWKAANKTIIELVPDAKQSEEFWNLWKGT